MKCDAFIIGSGLAGATCGYLLAREGRTVFAIDSADLTTKDKLCGGMLTKRSINALESIFGPEARALYRETFGSLQAVDVRVNRGSMVAQLDTHMSIVTRKELDAFAVCRFLDAGGMLADRSRLRRLDPLQRKACVETPFGEVEVAYRHLIVADGANSPTRSLLSSHDASLQAKPDVPLVPSIEALTEPTGSEPVGWYVPAIGGYCWYFPCGSQANIGAVGTKATAKELKATLSQFMHMMSVAEIRELRGAFSPSGGSYVAQSRDAFFIGDASGMVCPATSEGIYYALQTARVLSDCLLEGKDYEEAMAPYMRTLRIQYALSKFVLNDGFTRAGLRIAEAFHVDPAQIPRIALRFAGSFS